MHPGLTQFAGVLILAAVAAIALGFQMTDIGHFSGFVLMAITFIVAAIRVLWEARKP